MLGFLLAVSSSFFCEVSNSIGKAEIGARRVGIFTTGLLTLPFGIVFYAVGAAVSGSFHFSFGSLPTLLPRIVVEIVLSYITIKTLAKSDRSTFGFVRTLTIPLLLIADLAMGYSVSLSEIAGMGIISAIMFFVSISKKFSKEGIILLLLSTVLPVVTLTVYKYDIDHFNSVAAEQLIVSGFLLIFSSSCLLRRTGGIPFDFSSSRFF